MTERAPKGLRIAGDRRRWAEERLNEREADRVEALQAALDRGGRREVRFDGANCVFTLAAQSCLIRYISKRRPAD